MAQKCCRESRICLREVWGRNMEMFGWDNTKDKLARNKKIKELRDQSLPAASTTICTLICSHTKWFSISAKCLHVSHLHPVPLSISSHPFGKLTKFQSSKNTCTFFPTWVKYFIFSAAFSDPNSWCFLKKANQCLIHCLVCILIIAHRVSCLFKYLYSQSRFSMAQRQRRDLLSFAVSALSSASNLERFEQC